MLNVGYESGSSNALSILTLMLSLRGDSSLKF